MPFKLGISVPELHLYEATADGVLILDLSGIIKFANRKVYEILQRKSPELIDQICAEIQVDDSFNFQEILRKLSLNHSVLKPITCKKVDGTEVSMWGSFSFILDETSEPTGIILVLKEDQTMGDSEKEFLKQQSHLLRALNFRSEIPCIVYDVQKWTIIHCTDNIENLLGWKAEDFISGGSAFSLAITHPEDSDKLSEFVQNEISKRRNVTSELDLIPFNFESRKRQKNGKWKWIRSETSILNRESNGRILFALTFFKDISIEKENLLNAPNSDIDKLIDNSINANGNVLPTITPGAQRLTLREKEILALVKKGYSTKEISSKLSLTINTVNTYRKNLMNKMHAKNSAELVKIAMEQQII